MTKEELIKDAINIIKEISSEVKNIKDDDNIIFLPKGKNDDVSNIMLKVTILLTKYIPLFIENNMYTEGVKFTTSLTNALVNCDAIDTEYMDLSFINKPCYNMICEKGNITEEEVSTFRKKYEWNKDITPLDIFINEDIVF